MAMSLWLAISKWRVILYWVGWQVPYGRKDRSELNGYFTIG
jgi:hypothetical protein